MDSFRVHFELRDLAEIVPWGDSSTGLKLHWFGLTDGWYDLEIGRHRLFRVSGDDDRGVDYQVVRLWEDLIEIASAAMEDIPEPLARRLATGDRWLSWTEHVWDLAGADELYDAALSWWNAREFNAGYLRGAPRAHFWCRGEEIHIRWRSLPREADSPLWSSPSGDAVTPLAPFREGLVRFDHDLIKAMGERIDSIARRWSRPEIKIDVEQLRREHADRATWLESAFTTPRAKSHSWNDVIEAVTMLEQRIGSALTE